MLGSRREAQEAVEMEIICCSNKVGGDKGLKWSNTQERPSKTPKELVKGLFHFVCAPLPTTPHLSSHPVISTKSVEKYNPKTWSSIYYLFQPMEFFYFVSPHVVHSFESLLTHSDRDRQTDTGRPRFSLPM